MIVSVTEDAYKKIVNSHVGDKFKDVGYLQINIPEAVLYAKMKGYKIDRKEKDIRVIKAVLTNGRVTDIAVLVSADNQNLKWDRG